MLKFLSLLLSLSAATFYAYEELTVTRCKETSSKNHDYFLINQTDFIFDHPEGKRGLNYIEPMSIQNKNQLAGIFKSSGSFIEGHKNSHKRVVHIGLIEVSEGASKRLGEFKIVGDTYRLKKFKASLTILSASEEPNIKFYELSCENWYN